MSTPTSDLLILINIGPLVTVKMKEDGVCVASTCLPSLLPAGGPPPTLHLPSTLRLPASPSFSLPLPQFDESTQPLHHVSSEGDTFDLPVPAMYWAYQFQFQ